MPSLNKIAYNKQRRRINRFLRSAEKRGFSFEYKLPKPIKNPTKQDIEKLKAITPQILYEKATFTLPTGEVISGVEGRHYENSQRSKKSASTRKKSKTKQELESSLQRDREEVRNRFYQDRGIEPIASPITSTTLVLENVLDQIRSWDPLPYWSEFFTEQKISDVGILERMMQGAIRTYGEEEVARRLQDNADRVNNILQNVLYGSGGRDSQIDINFELVSFANILNGGYLSQTDSAMLTEASEYNEIQ